MTPDTSPAATTTSRANLALGLGLAALVTWFIAIAITGENGDDNGWIWAVMAVLGLAALVTGLRAGPGRPAGRALIGAAIGGLLFLVFLGFVIADAVS